MRKSVFKTIIMSLSTSFCQSAASASDSSARNVTLPDSTVSRSEEGGINSGGGNLCLIDGRWHLLEFAELANRPLRTGEYVVQSKEMLNSEGKSIEHVQLEVVGFYRSFEPAEGRLKKKLEEVLNYNERYSPRLVQALKALKPEYNITKYSTNYPLEADLEINSKCNSANVRAAVVYTKGGLAWLDLTRFNVLDLDSQAGLLIHERLRRLQDLLGRPGHSTKISNGVLQSIVRSMFYAPRNWDLHGFVKELWESPTAVVSHSPVPYSALSPFCRVSISSEPTQTLRDLASSICYLSEVPTPVRQIRKVISGTLPKLIAQPGALAASLSSEAAALLIELEELDLEKLTLAQFAQMSHWDSYKTYIHIKDQYAMFSAYEKYGSSSTLSAKDRQYLDRYEKAACSVRENIKDMMGDVNPSAIATTEKLNSPHPRCK